MVLGRTYTFQIIWGLLGAAVLSGQPAAPASDPLGRENPRAAITGFLEACRIGDYGKATQFLDLRHYPAGYQERAGPELARDLESIFNSDSHFSVLQVSRSAEGDLSDDRDPNREHVLTIVRQGRNLTLDLERTTLKPGGTAVWLFSADTVAAIPKLEAQATPAAVERYLPPFLVSRQILETSLWKWLALILLVSLMVALSRLADRLLVALIRLPGLLQKDQRFLWLEALIEPLRVILWLALFRIGLEVIGPSAIARLYIARGMAVVLAWSIGWSLIRLIGLLMGHMEARLDPHQQMAARTMMRLGKRTVNLIVIVVTLLVLLQNWGYNTSTLIAGLGVGGIAVALAAQQTIANIFGGVSLVGDHPVRIGDFGKFGDMVGAVEDIGMRSTRIRTLNRTIVSVPNANFAGLNLENYSVRDKILFNPTFQVKRTVGDEQLKAVMGGIGKLLSSRPDLEPAPEPARIVGLTSGAFNLEIFCYVRTIDIHEFYRVQGALLLRLNELFQEFKIELV